MRPSEKAPRQQQGAGRWTLGGKGMHYTDELWKEALGVRAQVITRIRTNCPGLNWC